MKDDGHQGWEQRALPAQLSDALGLSEQTVRELIDAGLMRCSAEDSAVEIELTDAAAVRSLCVDRPHAPGKLRKTLDRLHAWLPSSADPMGHVTLVHRDGPLLVRLPNGTLADAAGQFRFNFKNGVPLGRIGPHEPITAMEWHEHGIEQECADDLAAAVASYTRALLIAGPDAQIVFDLAYALAELGHLDRAIERYRQVVELDPLRADAWNNLGDLLLTDDQPAEAINAFRHALDLTPDDAAAHYNLADALDTAGFTTPARLHWQAFARLTDDTSGPHAAYARSQLPMMSFSG